MSNIITEITVQKKNKRRINVFIDNQYAFSVNSTLVPDIKTGDQISEDRINQLKRADEADKAYNRALYFLKFRPRSRAEIARNLKEKQFSPEAITNTITRLETNGLIDDLAFARLFVENRRNFSPKGVYALRYELRAKGISEKIIETVLDDYDEKKAAWAALFPKIKQWENLETKEFKKKAFAFLRRRGFGYDICTTVCDRMIEAS
jgi:regulatory protein